MGNPQEFLTSPHIRPSSNAGNLVHYLQQTQWNHFLNETPLRSQMLSQRLSFQSLPQLPHSSRFLPLPQSGTKSVIPSAACNFQGTQVCEESAAILESIWQILSFLTSLASVLRPEGWNGLSCSINYLKQQMILMLSTIANNKFLITYVLFHRSFLACPQ